MVASNNPSQAITAERKAGSMLSEIERNPGGIGCYGSSLGDEIRPAIDSSPYDESTYTAILKEANLHFETARLGELIKQEQEASSLGDDAHYTIISIMSLSDYGLNERAIVNQLHISQPTIHYWLNNNSHRELNNNSTTITHLEYIKTLSEYSSNGGTLIKTLADYGLTELVKWGILLNIRALENYLVSNRFSASLFFWQRFYQVGEKTK